ncbi:MAG TPA: serine protease [Thermoanaerobaculia bacterium]
MKRAPVVVVISLLLSLTSRVSADGVPGGWQTSSDTPVAQAPLRALQGSTGLVVASLTAIPGHEIETLRRSNTGTGPPRIGFVRALPNPYAVQRNRAIQATSASREWNWRGTVEVEGGHRLRLKLEDVHVPPTATFWVYGAGGDISSFDGSLAHDGVLWTPSVAGQTITLEVRTQNGEATSFTVAAVGEMRGPDEVVAHAACLQDARCFTGLEDYGTSVAHMVYASGANLYVCTGGLILDSARTFAPYFITANHCISTAAEAASLETFWDYTTSNCGGATPPLSTLPRRSGSTLLATSATSDLSLLRLHSTPPGSRWFFGWTTTPPSAGETLHRLSHPDSQPQRYSASTVDTISTTCFATPRTSYIYSKPTVGTVIGGSSGSPIFKSNGQIVGALTGGCPGNADACGTSMRTIDGAFSSAYASVFKPFLNPDVTQCSPCVANQTTSCLLGNRFKVTMSWSDSFANLSGVGSRITYAENLPEIHPQFGPLSESAFFSMYSFSPKSIETLVRMIKGANINDKYWVFVTGFAGAQYTVTIQDSQSCATWQRTIPSGATTMLKDFEAFPFP